MTIAFLGRLVTPRARPAARRRPAPIADVEALESRQLLTHHGMRSSASAPGVPNVPAPTQAAFSTLLSSLQGGLVVGPLLQLSRDNTPDGERQYVASAGQLITKFREDALALRPGDRRLQQLVDLQADALTATIVSTQLKHSLNLPVLTITSPELLEAGLSGGPDYYGDQLNTVTHLMLSRPLWAYNTPLLGYINRTETFEAELKHLADAFGSSQITVDQASTLAHVNTTAYKADIINATLDRASLRHELNDRADDLVSSIDAALRLDDPAPALAAAIQTFTAATYDQQTGAGYLGPDGAYGRRLRAQQPTNGRDVASPGDLLPYYYGNTFANGQYAVQTLQADTVYHRNFGVGAAEKGKYLTSALYASPAEAIRKSALDQTFVPSNSAIYVVDVTVPAGTTVHVGKVAPIYQGILSPVNSLYPGLGPQIVALKYPTDPGAYTHARLTGT